MRQLIGKFTCIYNVTWLHVISHYILSYWQDIDEWWLDTFILARQVSIHSPTQQVYAWYSTDWVLIKRSAILHTTFSTTFSWMAIMILQFKFHPNNLRHTWSNLKIIYNDIWCHKTTLSKRANSDWSCFLSLSFSGRRHSGSHDGSCWPIMAPRQYLLIFY